MFNIKGKYKKGGKVDMCQGLKEWIEDERMEGRMEGLSQGRLEGLSQGRLEGEELFICLTEKLLKDGRMEDLTRAVEDKDYRKQMYSEYSISNN